MCIVAPRPTHRWNDFRCDNINAQNVLAVADKMSELGLDKHGYEYINIDGKSGPPVDVAATVRVADVRGGLLCRLLGDDAGHERRAGSGPKSFPGGHVPGLGVHSRQGFQVRHLF